MSIHDEIDLFLAQSPRTPDAMADDLRDVEAALARLDAGWQRLEATALAPTVPGSHDRRTDAGLHELRGRLFAERDALLGQWCQLLAELRLAGGSVEWSLPVEAPSAVQKPGVSVLESIGHAPLHIAVSHGLARAPARPVDSTPATWTTERRLPALLAAHLQRADATAVPVDDRQLQKLQAALRGESAVTRAQSQPFDAPRWLELSSNLGDPPPDLTTEAVVKSEFKRLERFGRPERLLWVAEMPRDVQCLLIGHLVARARCLQEAPAVHHLVALDLDKAMEPLFSAWTSHQRAHQPGFVHGLGRHHTAERGTWHADARALWHELAERATILADEPTLNPERELRALEQLLEARADVEQVVAQLDVSIAAGVAQDDQRLMRMLQPWPEAVKFARFKTLRRAIRASEEVEDADAEEPSSGPPSDWAHWPVVKERRAAILGGTPREPARARIEKTFGMDELTWVQVDQHKQLDSLAARIRAGGLDLLLLLQSFASHKASDKLVDACRDAGVPFVPIEHGYGVARIQRAIEEHVGGRQPAAPVASPS